MEIVQIDIKKVNPNAYNPNVMSEEMLNKLREEIRSKGMCAPILVRPLGGDGDYEIVDGYHRWTVCQELGFTTVPCVVKEYDDKEAKIKTLQMNYMRGEAAPLKLAMLLHDLNREITLDDLSGRLPYDEGRIQDSLELLKLPEDFMRQIEDQAAAEEKEAPMVMTFVFKKEQVDIINQAVALANDLFALSATSKNVKAASIECICRHFIETAKQIETNTA